MKASVIIPHLPKSKTLRQTLDSIDAASSGVDVQVVTVEDTALRGPSWARNRGLEKAVGDFIFFADSDDTVEPGFFSRPIEALQKSGADFCLFDGVNAPLRRSYALDGAEAVRTALLSAFLGYSFDDVRRWNSGGRLDERRELGYVWRAAFRRDFIESNHLRFDEAMQINEDAAFLAECALCARKVCSLHESLYTYRPSPSGLGADASRKRLRREYKFAALAFRKRLSNASNGLAWLYCEASVVFSALELLRCGDLAALRRYAADTAVKDALRKFPTSIHHPATALAVAFLRAVSPCC